MNGRSSTPPREWRKAGSNASRIDLSGYASSQHRRFLKAEAEQATGEPGIADEVRPFSGMKTPQLLLPSSMPRLIRLCVSQSLSLIHI